MYISAYTSIRHQKNNKKALKKKDRVMGTEFIANYKRTVKHTLHTLKGTNESN